MAPEFREQLQKVLVQAFGKNGLVQFARIRLTFDDVQFVDVVNFDKADNEIAFQMVEVADQYGHVDKLVPRHPGGAAQFTGSRRAGDCLRAPAGGSPPAPLTQIPDKVKDAIIRFNDRFQQRQKQFRYLNAYKQFHDLLHNLQDFLPEIIKVAAAVRRPLDDFPDPTVITDRLQDRVNQATESVKGTEFPKHHALDRQIRASGPRLDPGTFQGRSRHDRDS